MPDVLKSARQINYTFQEKNLNIYNSREFLSK